MAEISIIVPLYNQAGRIRETLGDILSQSAAGLEVILVDDASTDDSVSVAEKTLENSGAKWTLLRHDSNRGASEARNTGLEFASGKSVFFLDADDRMAPQTLEWLCAGMEKCGSPLAFCGFRVRGEKREPGKTYSFPARPGEICVPSETVLRAFLRGKRYLNASNVLYGRSFLQEHRIRFPRGCRFAEDREFIVKACLHAGNIAVVSRPLVTYVQHPGQSTSLMGNDPNKYAHAVGVYLRLRKVLCAQSASPGLLGAIDSFELPNSVLKMATSAARSGREDLYWRFAGSRRLREIVARGTGALLIKPEVALKSFLFVHAPKTLLALYPPKRRED